MGCSCSWSWASILKHSTRNLARWSYSTRHELLTMAELIPSLRRNSLPPLLVVTVAKVDIATTPLWAFEWPISGPDGLEMPSILPRLVYGTKQQTMTDPSLQPTIKQISGIISSHKMRAWSSHPTLPPSQINAKLFSNRNEYHPPSISSTPNLSEKNNNSTLLH